MNTLTRIKWTVFDCFPLCYPKAVLVNRFYLFVCLLVDWLVVFLSVYLLWFCLFGFLVGLGFFLMLLFGWFWFGVFLP